MSDAPNFPKMLRGGIVLVDIDTAAVQRLVILQYNPDTLTRSLQVQGATGEATDYLEALRLKGPPIETIRLDAEIDATDQLEHSDENPDAISYGIFPQLAALETIVYPTSAQTLANNSQAMSGAMEMIPVAAPLQLFVWSRQRVLPVRITDLSITEEQFSTQLNPTRAKVSLTMRVLSTNDLGFDNKGGSLFMQHLIQKEKLAKLGVGALSTLGLRGIS